MQARSSTPDLQVKAGIPEPRGNGQGAPAPADAVRSVFSGLDAGASLDQVKAGLARGVTAAKAALDTAVERTRRNARATDAYVHHKPWQAIGVGAAIGLVLGLLLARRTSRAALPPA